MTAQGETRALLILSVWAVSREITGVIGNVFVIQYVCEWMTKHSYGVIWCIFVLEAISLSCFKAWLNYLVTENEILYVS